MSEGKIGEGGWANVPGTAIRVYATLQVDGWEYGAYDTRTMTCIKKGFADGEIDAHVRVEGWLIAAGIAQGAEALDWIPM